MQDGEWLIRHDHGRKEPRDHRGHELNIIQLRSIILEAWTHNTEMYYKKQDGSDKNIR